MKSKSFPISKEDQKRLLTLQIDSINLPKNLKRTLMNPENRPYHYDVEYVLKEYLAPQKIISEEIKFLNLTDIEAVNCEKLFFNEMFKSLLSSIEEKEKNIDGKEKSYDPNKIVQLNRTSGWKDVALNFSDYYRQVVGFQYKDIKYIYMKFSAQNDFGDKEYAVDDGGSAYFVFYCDMKAKKIFSSYVHGRA